MVEYTIDDIRGPTVAREMAQLKEFVLEKFNGAIADAEAAAAAAATAAANAVLANTVKKTGEASQSIAGDVTITGALDAAAIGTGSTPIVCGDLTAFGNVSLDDTVLQGNLSAADSSALINLSGVGSVLVPDSTLGSYSAKEAVNAPRLKNELDNYAPMLRSTGNQSKAGLLTLINGYDGYFNAWHGTSESSMSIGQYCIFAEIQTDYNGRFLLIDFIENSNTAACNGRMIIRCNSTDPFPIWLYRKSRGSNNPLSATAITVLSDGSKLYLAWKKESTYGGVSAALVQDINYGNVSATSSTNITWYAQGSRIVTSDISAYTEIAVIE